MIRPATPADTDALRACIEAAYAPYVPRIGRRPAPMDADLTAQIAAGQVHLHESREGIDGMIVFYPEGEAMFLETIAVWPARAGRGIGARLIDCCEAAARARGLGAVRLYTNVRMVENLTLYPHLGYHETHRAREDGFDRVYFEKRLGRDPTRPDA